MLRRSACICIAALLPLIAGCEDDRRSESQPIQPIPGSGVTTGGNSTGGTGGSSPSTGTGDMPAEPACTRDVAFRAAGLSFVEPTPSNLASRLNELGYGYDAQGLTVVLAAAAGTPRLSVSATEDVSGSHQFVAPPTAAGAQLSAGGFESTETQDEATLQLWVDGNLVDVVLRNVNLRARTMGDCAEAWVFVDAVIPESEGVVDLGGTTISDLAGPVAGTDEQPGLGWPVQIMFSTESVPFDFGTMPGAQ